MKTNILKSLFLPGNTSTHADYELTETLNKWGYVEYAILKKCDPSGCYETIYSTNNYSPAARQFYVIIDETRKSLKRKGPKPEKGNELEYEPTLNYTWTIGS